MLAEVVDKVIDDNCPDSSLHLWKIASRGELAPAVDGEGEVVLI